MTNCLIFDEDLFFLIIFQLDFVSCNVSFLVSKHQMWFYFVRILMFTRYFCLPDAWFSSCILLEIVFKSVQKMLEIVGDRVVVVGDNFVHVGDSFVDKWNMPRRQTTKVSCSILSTSLFVF